LKVSYGASAYRNNLLELIAPANGIRNRNRAKASKLERMSESDEKLLGRMLEGDEEAFTALYRRRQGPVYRFALHMTGSAAIAEDVTQEVFLALIENGRRFDGSRGPLLSFLYGIARNRVLRRIEKDRPAEPFREEFAAGEDLLDDLTRRETVEQVRRAVLSLPEAYREAVVLCDLENTSYEDAAAALECPVGTVRSRLSRGRAMLAQKLAARVVRSVS
jgi:RNA polymerase sigma-70 factor (ECF subfamily)